MIMLGVGIDAVAGMGSALRRTRACCKMTPAMPPTGNSEELLPPATSHGEPLLTQHSGYRAPSGDSRRLLRLALPAEPISISVARSEVHRWLAGWSWPACELADIVLAVSEAVSNAIEHAYLDQPPGMVEVRGGVEATRCGHGRVTIIVRDHGRWRPPPRDNPNRRRGISLMRACVASVTIGQLDDDPVGTRVVLRSRTVPPQEPGTPDNKSGDTPC